LFDIDLTKSVMGTATIAINKPVAEVFDFVAVNFFENYPKWAPEVVEFEPLNGSSVEVGAQARQLRYDQTQEAETILQVTTFEPEKQLVLEAVTGEFRDSYDFENCSDLESTKLTFRFEMLHLDVFMRPFAKLIKVAIEEGVTNSLENVKNLIIHEENVAEI